MALELSASAFALVTYLVLAWTVALALFIVYLAITHRDELLSRGETPSTRT